MRIHLCLFHDLGLDRPAVQWCSSYVNQLIHYVCPLQTSHYGESTRRRPLSNLSRLKIPPFAVGSSSRAGIIRDYWRGIRWIWVLHITTRSGKGNYYIFKYFYGCSVTVLDFFQFHKFRLICGADMAHKEVNDMVMNMHYSKFVQPTKAEGFDQVWLTDWLDWLRKT